MNIKDISISKGMTVNLGHYNSHRVDVGMTASFDADDDIEAGMEKLTHLVNKKLADEVKQVTEEKAKRQTLMEDGPPPPREPTTYKVQL